MELILPADSSPEQDPSALWSLQLQLLELAEGVLGPRDGSRVMYQRVFTDAGPNIRNTPNFDGAFAELSRSVEAYWPTAVYELAHETVHLLNPLRGNGNWLSEGIAVAFSDYAQRCHGMEPQKVGMASYRRAQELVSELPPDPLTAARRIRNACGSLEIATRCILEKLFPSVDPTILTQLCEPFERDWTK